LRSAPTAAFLYSASGSPLHLNKVAIYAVPLGRKNAQGVLFRCVAAFCRAAESPEGQVFAPSDAITDRALAARRSLRSDMPLIGRLALPLRRLGAIAMQTPSAVKRDGKIAWDLNTTAHRYHAEEGGIWATWYRPALTP